jgi:hypothetical protein
MNCDREGMLLSPANVLLGWQRLPEPLTPVRYAVLEFRSEIPADHCVTLRQPPLARCTPQFTASVRKEVAVSPLALTWAWAGLRCSEYYYTGYNS